MPGGRIPPDNRGPQAKGVGQNSKRHDMERRTTPYLHDSDLQQGDVQAMEDGQRVAPAKSQPPAAPQPTTSNQQAQVQATGSGEIPDPIDFLASIAGGGVNVPSGGGVAPSANMDAWVRFARHLVNGPGSSGLLAGAYINQVRQLIRQPQAAESVMINLNDLDDALELALDEGL